MKKLNRIISLIALLLVVTACSKDTPIVEPFQHFQSSPEYITHKDTLDTGPGYEETELTKWIWDLKKKLAKDKQYDTYKVQYKTLDQNNVPVTASALITVPKDGPVSRVYLVNHGTHIGRLMVPTLGMCVEEVVATSGALCIFPDYIGLGDSSDHVELYLNAEVHGRTSTDALKVLLDFAKKEKVDLKPDFDTYIMGYSQGGAVSLATLKHIQQLPDYEQAMLHLKKVYCGDGPYDLRQTFETYMSDYEQGKPLGLPAVIPMVLSSMFHSYPNETRNINYKDLFTTKAWLTGVPKAIYNNDENMLDVMVLMSRFDLGDVLDMRYINRHQDEFNLLLSLMERQNLTKGWELKYPCRFLHANPDAVVPFSNYEAAFKGLNNNMFEAEAIDGDPEAEPMQQHGTGMKQFLQNVMDENF